MTKTLILCIYCILNIIGCHNTFKEQTKQSQMISIAEKNASPQCICGNKMRYYPKTNDTFGQKGSVKYIKAQWL